MSTPKIKKTKRQHAFSQQPLTMPQESSSVQNRKQNDCLILTKKKHNLKK